jgi:hypothetical protein
MLFGTSNTERMRIDSSGNVGIGTSSPSTYGKLVVDDGKISLVTDTASSRRISFWSTANGNSENAYIQSQNDGGTTNTGEILFATKNVGGTLAERMRIDANGTVFIDKGTDDAGYGPLQLGNTSSSNTILQFLSSTSGANTIHFGDAASGTGRYAGYIQYDHNTSNLTIEAGNVIRFSVNGSNKIILDSDEFYPVTDNLMQLGWASGRYTELFAVTGTINTSDQNEKQDIENLSDAELRVATAAKGLMKKFRFKDAVAEKGDNARIHVGIIAQELQAAFEAEGLDASKYGMFCSDTWWEKDRVVPATEEVPEHTVTDTFRTAEEAPEDAIEKTRLGVRYEELLAFIIAAI